MPLPRLMRAARLETAAHRLRVAELPLPHPGVGEVLVRVMACGICLSDVHIIDGSLPVPLALLTPGHEAAGVMWSLVPLVVIVVSGVVISYRWAGDLVYRIAGDAPPAATPRPPAPAGGVAGGVAGGSAVGRGGETAPQSFAHLDRLYQEAATLVPDWRTLGVVLPASADAPVSITIDRGTGGQPQHRATLTLDPSTGAQVAWVPFDALSPGRRARSYLRFAHTGEYYALFGQRSPAWSRWRRRCSSRRGSRSPGAV